MQSSSILCYPPNPISTHLHLSGPHALAFFHGKNQLNSKPVVSFSCKSPWPSLHKRPQSRFAIKYSATKEIVETTTSSASSFVETGYIFGVHGLQGEVRVKPNTDFPELRFSEPGTRWLKQQVMGIEIIKEIELVEGRGHPGKNWIVKFKDINTVEEARKIVGATILVTDEDRPALEEGEFYTRDLIGMRVILKESGESVGTVVNVFNSGASDLLHVKLSSMRNIPDQNGKSNVVEGDSGQLAWVPFVKAIVPVVDPEKGEMLITPPKGLLELNIRSNDKSKKERRELDWKERQKFQRRLMAAKKKLREINQQHVFHGFRHGEKDEKSLLANQIVTVKSKLLRQALQSIENPSTRLNLLDVSAVPRSNTLKVSKSKKPSDPYSKMQREGCLLTSSGKTAMVLMLDEIKKTSDANEDPCVLIKALLEDENRFAKIEDRKTVPLVLVTSSGLSYLQELFLDNDYFAFDPEKVWFLEDGKLPVVSNTFGEHKILMKSPWEILQRPIGSGGLITLFSSQEPLLDQLSEFGIEYIELCNAKRKREDGCTLLGLVHSRKLKANVGIRLVKGLAQEEDFQMIFSLSFFRKLTKRIKELRFEAVSSCNSYVEKVDKDWVDVIPTTPNSYEFRSSIYNVLDTTPVDKVCVLDSRESRD